MLRFREEEVTVATSTARFGAGKREGHDASDFYARRMVQRRAVEDLGDVADPPAEIIDQLFLGSSETMAQIPDNCVALMVTSPPYNVGKDYDDDLAIDEYLDLLRRVFEESYRVIEPGGRIAINVANLGRKPYLPLTSHRYRVRSSGRDHLAKSEVRRWFVCVGVVAFCEEPDPARCARIHPRRFKGHLLEAAAGRGHDFERGVPRGDSFCLGYPARVGASCWTSGAVSG